MSEETSSGDNSVNDLEGVNWCLKRF
jgi:hypothetical protein